MSDFNSYSADVDEIILLALGNTKEACKYHKLNSNQEEILTRTINVFSRFVFRFMRN